MAIRNSSWILQPIHRHLLSCTSSSSAATGLAMTGSGSSLSHNFRRDATVATSPAPSRSASPVRSNDTRRRSTSFGFPADKRNNPPHFKPTSTKRTKRTAVKCSIQALYGCTGTEYTLPTASPQLLPCQLAQCLYHPVLQFALQHSPPYLYLKQQYGSLPVCA